MYYYEDHYYYDEPYKRQRNASTCEGTLCSIFVLLIVLIFFVTFAYILIFAEKSPPPFTYTVVINELDCMVNPDCDIFFKNSEKFVRRYDNRTINTKKGTIDLGRAEILYSTIENTKMVVSNGEIEGIMTPNDAPRNYDDFEDEALSVPLDYYNIPK